MNHESSYLDLFSKVEQYCFQISDLPFDTDQDRIMYIEFLKLHELEIIGQNISILNRSVNSLIDFLHNDLHEIHCDLVFLASKLDRLYEKESSK